MGRCLRGAFVGIFDVSFLYGVKERESSGMGFRRGGFLHVVEKERRGIGLLVARPFLWFLSDEDDEVRERFSTALFFFFWCRGETENGRRLGL